MIMVDDPLGNSTTLEYSPLDDLTSIVNALGGNTSFAYDADRNLTSVTDANTEMSVLLLDLSSG